MPCAAGTAFLGVFLLGRERFGSNVKTDPFCCGTETREMFVPVVGRKCLGVPRESKCDENRV